jgi:hypothetical protein
MMTFDEQVWAMAKNLYEQDSRENEWPFVPWSEAPHKIRLSYFKIAAIEMSEGLDRV